jgi:hypothetical protein
VAQRASRKRRRRRAPAANAPSAGASERRPGQGASGASRAAPGGSAEPRRSAMERGYARGRAKDAAARASLKPLAPGERPTAVTVGAIGAAALALANVVALVAGWDAGPGSGDDDGKAIAGSVLVTGVLCVVAYGMWRARYWAVLGMQTLLAITIIFAALGLVTATDAWAALVLVAIICAAGALFWFLVKAMARIQMPERPRAG